MQRPAVLFLPGLLCDAALWRDQCEALAFHAHCIVADLAVDDTLRAMAARALQGCPARFAVVGLSMGGYVAFELMRLAPDRISGLCLMSTSARPDTAVQARRRRALMALVARGSRFRGVTPGLLPSLLHPDNLSDAALADGIAAMADRVGKSAYLRQQAVILARPDSRPDLPGIQVPTLVVAGEADVLTPPGLAAEMAAGIPGAVLHILPGAGHLPPLERPAATSALLLPWFSATLASPGRPGPV